MGALTPDPENDSNSALTPATSSTPTPGQSCSDVCSANDNVYEGTCGWFNRKNDKRWCTTPLYDVEVCCASNFSDDCCLLDEGRIAGVAVGIFVAISIGSGYSFAGRKLWSQSDFEYGGNDRIHFFSGTKAK